MRSHFGDFRGARFGDGPHSWLIFYIATSGSPVLTRVLCWGSFKPALVAQYLPLSGHKATSESRVESICGNNGHPGAESSPTCCLCAFVASRLLPVNYTSFKNTNV